MNSVKNSIMEGQESGKPEDSTTALDLLEKGEVDDSITALDSVVDILLDPAAEEAP